MDPSSTGSIRRIPTSPRSSPGRVTTQTSPTNPFYQPFWPDQTPGRKERKGLESRPGSESERATGKKREELGRPKTEVSQVEEDKRERVVCRKFRAEKSSAAPNAVHFGGRQGLGSR